MREPTPQDLRDLREKLGLSQTQMAHEMGLGLRAYQTLEAPNGNVRKLHWVAAQRVSLYVAATKGDPMMAEPTARVDALKIAKILIS